MNDTTPNDESAIDAYRWLVGPEANEWLQQVAGDEQSLVSQAARLRRRLSPRRTHLVLEQVELRRRAGVKFPEADRMFFTALGLEQASDHWLAAYKAARFPPREPVADLCCGIGGDLLGLARRGPVVGVDRDPTAALLAEANARAAVFSEPQAAGVTVRTEDVAAVELESFAAWHLDPDRRPQGRRTTTVELHEPGLPVIERLLAASEQAALKLAPAAIVPDAWSCRAELEWISRDRQCRQLVVWFGRLAEHPGRRRATLLAAGPGDASPASHHSFVGQADLRLPPAERIGRYVFDCDPAVRAARLTAALAADRGLEVTGARAAYLTGDREAVDPLLSCFEVTDVLPLDVRRLKRLFHQRGIGRLEIKKRGVAHEPEQLRRQLHLRGDESAVLLLVPIDAAATAIVARRMA